MNHKRGVTDYASEKTLARGRAIPQACRYNPYRARLLDALRQRRGGAYIANRSLIVLDALDELLKSEGLLPEDAPRQSELILERTHGAGAGVESG